MRCSFGQYLLAAVVLGSLAACGAKLNPAIDCINDPNIATDPNAPFSYATDIKPLTNTYCTCHSKAVLNRQNAPTRVLVDSFSDIKVFANEVNQTVLGGTMPPNSAMDPNDRCKLNAWYRNGMKP